MSIPKSVLRILLLVTLLVGVLPPPAPVRAKPAFTSANELIAAMNSLRAANGLRPLVEDPIVNAVAQGTAQIMASNQMSWHIGDVPGRLAAAGYGGGAKVWATENFAVGTDLTIDEIMVMWADPDHMIPAVRASYCHVGAGTAVAPNGMTYYVLQAAYTATNSCGPYNPPAGGATPRPGTTAVVADITVPQIIMPVKVATPDAEGKIYHVVEAGQTFWAIAVAYKVTIKDIETWNNISAQTTKLQIGQKLFIPSANTAGYSTPTPVGMVQISTPEADGSVVHTVQAYQTLSTIAKAYAVPVDTILTLNGLQLDWPLQIGQKLLMKPSPVTPSPTPRPLTPLERLTPAADGLYYHTVGGGETLSYIANLYGVSVGDLMAWNSLNEASILFPEQKLLLQVTPPVPPTFTPAPVTETPTPPPATATLTPDLVGTAAAATLTAAAPASMGGVASPTAGPAQETASAIDPSNPLVWFISMGVVGGGLFLVAFFTRKKGGAG